MTDINLQTITPDTTLPTTGFLFGADSQASGSPSVFTVQSVATTLLGSTTLTGATITADAPVLNLAQTWNNAAVTFTGLKLNATDTASAAGSLLLDIGTGGGTYSSKFSVNKIGYVSALSFFATNVVDVSIGARLFGVNGGSLILGGASQGGIYFTPTTNQGSTPDTIITRRGERNLRFGAADAATALAQTLSVQSVVAGTTNTAGANLTITGSQGTGTGAGGSIIFQVAPAGSSGSAQNALSTALQINGDGSITGQDGATANTLAQRNGVNPQTFRLYNTFTDASNYERFETLWSANVLYLINTAAGTGAARELVVGTNVNSTLTLRTNTTNRWQIPGATGHLLAALDNTYDIGALGATRPRIGYFGTGILSPYIQFNSEGRISPLGDGIVRFTNAALNDFNRMVFGGSTSAFPALKRNSTALETKLADDSAYAPHAMQYLDVTDGITAPAAATGRARIYVDTADGDLKVIFADGTIKTIVTDT